MRKGEERDNNFMKKIFCILLISALLSGCNSIETTENTQSSTEEYTEETTTSDTSENDYVRHDVPENFIAPTDYIDYEEEDYSDKYTNKLYDNSIIENGITYMEIKSEYPVFKGESEAINKINEDIEEYITNISDEYRKWWSDNDNGTWKEYVPTTYTYYSRLSFKVKKCDDKIISVLFTRDQYGGGVHTNLYFYTRTYNVKTGELMELGDFMDNPVEDVKKVVWDRAEYGNTGLFVNTTDGSEYENIKFYIVGDNVAVIFSPYEIGCYAAGKQEFRFRMSDKAYEYLYGDF